MGIIFCNSADCIIKSENNKKIDYTDVYVKYKKS